MSSQNKAAILLSDFQQVLRLDNLGGREADANTSATVNSNNTGVQLCTNKREKEAVAAVTTDFGKIQSKVLAITVPNCSTNFQLIFLCFLQAMRIV